MSHHHILNWKTLEDVCFGSCNRSLYFLYGNVDTTLQLPLEKLQKRRILVLNVVKIPVLNWYQNTKCVSCYTIQRAYILHPCLTQLPWSFMIPEWPYSVTRLSGKRDGDRREGEGGGEDGEGRERPDLFSPVFLLLHLPSSPTLGLFTIYIHSCTLTLIRLSGDETWFLKYCSIEAYSAIDIVWLFFPFDTS